jgi:excisionase family DNA binding protein
MPIDPLSAAIEHAVERALERTLPALIKANLPPPVQPQAITPAPIEGERFVTMREASKRLNCHRTTLLRMERQGRMPKRRRMSGRTGWLQSEIETYLASLSEASRHVRDDVH